VGIFLGQGQVERRQAFPEPPIAAFPGADIGGYVSVASKPDMAFQVPTVWACINLVAGAVSSLQLETFRRSTAPGAVPRRLADPMLILRPDNDMTQSEWLYMLVVSLLTRGNAIGVLGVDSALHAQTNHLLNFDLVKIEVDRDTGRITYTNKSSNRVIPSQLVWHVRGLTLPGSRVGLSPITYAAATLGLDLSSRQFASGFFDGGGIPKAILESDQQVSQEQARTIKDRVMATFRNREPAILGLGLKYTQIQVRPEESQFLQTQQANVAQICRYFGVPAAMVDGPAGGGMQYTNTEQRGIEFLTYTLAHWLRRIEDAISALLPNGQYVKFNTHSLLRLDAETQAKVDLQRLAGKVVAPSEIRARDGLDPMTDAQKAEADMVPLTVGPLGRPVGQPGLHNPPGPEAPVPGFENPTGA
jgi:HK97 family phage portal protein